MSLRRIFPLSALMVAGSSAAVVTPIYNQNFDGYTHNSTKTDFAENNDAAYLVINDLDGDLAFRGRMQTSTAASASVNVRTFLTVTGRISR